MRGNDTVKVGIPDGEMRTTAIILHNSLQRVFLAHHGLASPPRVVWRPDKGVRAVICCRARLQSGRRPASGQKGLAVSEYTMSCIHLPRPGARHTGPGSHLTLVSETTLPFGRPPTTLPSTIALAASPPLPGFRLGLGSCSGTTCVGTLSSCPGAPTVLFGVTLGRSRRRLTLLHNRFRLRVQGTAAAQRSAPILLRAAVEVPG